MSESACDRVGNSRNSELLVAHGSVHGKGEEGGVGKGDGYVPAMLAYGPFLRVSQRLCFMLNVVYDKSFDMIRFNMVASLPLYDSVRISRSGCGKGGLSGFNIPSTYTYKKFPWLNTRHETGYN